jgi:deoxyguanosine kinase
VIVALEGLPGVGKTTAAGLVAERLGALAVRETTANHPFLSQIYDDSERDDLTVELGFLLVHANPYRLLDPGLTTVCDFSPAKDIIFAEDMLSARDLVLFRAVYDRLYASVAMPDVAIYMKADAELCLARVRTRMAQRPDRSYESQMSLGRLRRMEAHYDRSATLLGKCLLPYEVQPQNGPETTADEIARLVTSWLERSDAP